MQLSPSIERRTARRLSGRRAGLGDRVFRQATVACAAGVLILLAAIAVVLLSEGRFAILRYGLSFVTSTDWDPVFEKFGTAGFIFGTVVSSIIALILATPIAASAALFIVEYAPGWLRGPVSFTVEMLAAIPSIIYGLWGFFVLAPFMRAHIEPALENRLGPVPVIGALFEGTAIGKDILTGGVILAIMIVPTIMSVSREILLTVPDTQREGMLALGATKWEMIRKAVLPYARSGIAAAAILGLARALGETMAVTLVIGNSTTDIRASLFTPGYTLASAIANQFTEADSHIYFSAIVAIALVLLLIASIMNILARLLVKSLARGGPADTRA